MRPTSPRDRVARTVECTVDMLDPAKLIVKLSGPPVFTNEDTFVRIERKR